MFESEYEQVDIMLGAGAGQVKEIGSSFQRRKRAGPGGRGRWKYIQCVQICEIKSPSSIVTVCPCDQDTKSD